MAEQIQVFGAAIIRVGTGSGGSLETLTSGGTRNGAMVHWDGYFGDVFADVNGGDEGPPIDMQYFGETARIELMLTKYDAAIANKLACRTRGGTFGVPADPSGLLMFQDQLSYRLLILGAASAVNFLNCVFREPITVNRGTKHSTLILQATAYKASNGVLFNAETG